MEAFRLEYNNYHPHSSLGYLTPAEFARRYYERHKEEQAIQPWGIVELQLDVDFPGRNEE